MKRISIQQAMINAVDETDPSLGRFQNQMMRWAKYLEREIGSKNGYKFKAKKFTVTGCTIELPEDCYRPVKVLPGDYEDVCNARYADLGWVNVSQDDRDDDYFSWLWTPQEASGVLPYLWEEVADELNLINEYSDVEMTLIYQYMETNDHGFWMVNDSHINAISLYIQYMFARKYRWRIFKSDKMLRTGHFQMIRDLERDYNIAVRHARAEDGRETPYDKSGY